MNRVESLQSLLKLDQPLSQILPFLNAFGWDSDREFVDLKRQHIITMLRRYLSGELSESCVEDWANAMEGREDVGYENGFEDLLSEVIYKLANPLLTHSLSKDFAKNQLEQLISESNKQQVHLKT